MSVNVVLIDDHPVVRAGLAALISDIDGFEVVGQASDGDEGLELVRALQPDIVLMDIQMPRMSGLECLKHISVSTPNARTLILSIHADEIQVRYAMELGARGYIHKGEDPEDIELAIRTVSTGALWYSSGISQMILGKRPAGDESSTHNEQLTPRQVDILKRLANGESTKQIAFDLGVSSKTVENHRIQIMTRLDVHGIAGLVRYAIRTRLIDA